MAPDNNTPDRTRKLRLHPTDIDGHQEFEIDRPGGFLTEDDRRYLIKDSKDRSERAVQEKHRRLRSRTRNALMEFTLLEDGLARDDQQAIFDPHGAALESSDEITGSVISLLSFVYESYKHSGESFESILTAAIERVEHRHGWRDVEVTFDVRRSNREVDIEAALAKFEEGDPLTDREVGALLRSDQLPPERWADLADRLDPEVAEATELVKRLSGSETEPEE